VVAHIVLERIEDVASVQRAAPVPRPHAELALGQVLKQGQTGFEGQVQIGDVRERQVAHR
jgi:hypothetical protein